MRCSFSPYEGDQKYIFVSYSHSNGDKVAPILERLNSEGFRMWYDDGIEWGSEWPESIASHLRQCEVCMAFHSKASVLSANCRQEIHYALKMQKGILSVYLEDVELSEGMDMQLTPFQSTFPYQYANQEDFFNRLAETKIIQECRGTADKSDNGSNLDKINQLHAISVDTELEKKYQELFGEPRTEPDQSPLEKKLEVVKTRNFMESIISRLPAKEDLDLSDDFDTRISLVPIGYTTRKSTGKYQIVSGKHFTIPDVPGYKTVLFRIIDHVDYKTLTRFYTCEMLDTTPSIASDGTVLGTMYFVDDPQTEEDLTILHLNAETGDVYVNMGILKGDHVTISTCPTHIAFEKQHLDNTYHLSPVGYDLDHINEEELYPEKGQLAGEKWYDADIRKSPIIILDPETALPVKRELYYDESLQEWRARIKLVPYKSYFTFQIKDGDNRTSRPLSSFEIAKYYREGSFGFPKDLFKAVSYFEEDGSAEALYEVAVLFRSEKSIYDKETYLDYLHQAAESGCAEASIEYALLLLEDPSHDNKEQAELWWRNVQPDFPLKNFVLGYLIENGMAAGTIEDAYQTYLKAALDHFEPACVRLGHQKISEDSETLKEGFFNQLSYGNTIADYCMGCILFFGIDILPNKEKGIKFLKKSSEAGNVMAAQALHEIGEIEPEFAEDIAAFFQL